MYIVYIVVLRLGVYCVSSRLVAPACSHSPVLYVGLLFLPVTLLRHIRSHYVGLYRLRGIVVINVCKCFRLFKKKSFTNVFYIFFNVAVFKKALNGQCEKNGNLKYF